MPVSDDDDTNQYHDHFQTWVKLGRTGQVPDFRFEVDSLPLYHQRLDHLIIALLGQFGLGQEW